MVVESPNKIKFFCKDRNKKTNMFPKTTTKPRVPFSPCYMPPLSLRLKQQLPSMISCSSPYRWSRSVIFSMGPLGSRGECFARISVNTESTHVLYTVYFKRTMRGNNQRFFQNNSAYPSALHEYWGTTIATKKSLGQLKTHMTLENPRKCIFKWWMFHCHVS